MNTITDLSLKSEKQKLYGFPLTIGAFTAIGSPLEKNELLTEFCERLRAINHPSTTQLVEAYFKRG